MSLDVLGEYGKILLAFSPYALKYFLHILRISYILYVPRAPDEEDQSAAGLLLRTYSAGPVPLICFDV